MAALGIFGFIIFLGVGVVQIYAGFIGIEYHLGYWWAIAAVGASFLLRIMLPLTIGTFFGIINVLEWHWVIALLLTLPSLIFITPRKFKSTFNYKNFESESAAAITITTIVSSITVTITLLLAL